MSSMCSSVLFLCVLQYVACFNLEPRIPVIKLGEPGSYFGFSVAEHLTVKGNENTSWLLVGAPLGQNLQPNTSRSGALWKCGLTTAIQDCEQIVTDGKRTIDDQHLWGPHKDEIKDGQWLGVSVRSQGPGKRAVVCAHRYIVKKGESQHGLGLCYTLNNELMLAVMWEPCRGLPLEREHEDFGFCQAGTSSYLLDDDTLLLGSPGPFTWRGTIFAQDSEENYMSREFTVFRAPVEDRVSPVEKYSYLGMSVTGAKFFEPDHYSYVTGAPRARGTGQVIIFQKRINKSYEADYYLLKDKMIFNGEQFGSSFGYEVAAADVNGDGKPDLLIGAPFYFNKHSGGAVYLYLNDNYTLKTEYSLKLTGKPESQFGISIASAGDLNKDGCEDIAVGSPYEGNGVVYIHLGNRKNGLLTKADQVITAEALPKVLDTIVMKTFGYSISGGTDLDANGYPDLLVGAYEDSSVALIRTRPIIDISTRIISSSINNIDPMKHGCEEDRTSNYTCFSFQACCKISSFVKSARVNTHTVNYVVKAETFLDQRKFSRVFFGTDKMNEIDRNITVDDREICKEHVVYLKNNTRDIQSPIKFQLTYNLVQDEPKYKSTGPLPNIDEYPVLNATATTTFTANFLNDCGDDDVCKSDLDVTAQLSLPEKDDTAYYALTLGQDNEIKLSVTVKNFGESAYQAQLLVKHKANLHYVAADVKDKRVVCSSANKTIVSCFLENPLKRQTNPEPITLRFDARALDDKEPEIAFTVWANSTYEVQPKEPKVLRVIIVKNAELSIKGAARPEQVFYGGEVKGESAMKYFDDIGTRVAHTYLVFNKGPWHVHNPLVEILWPHQVSSDSSQGKWLLYPEDVPIVEGEAGQNNGNCFISQNEINPLKLTPRPGLTEPLLENLEIEPLLTGKLSVSSTEKEHNDTKNTIENFKAAGNKVRRKRDSDIIKAEAYTDMNGERKHVVNMNCKNKTAKCIRIQCVIFRLDRQQTATITVRARLWNSTLVEDYPRVSHVNIASTGYIRINENYNIIGAVDPAKVETVAYPDLNISEPTEVPYWVIIVSVIVGLIVLILLIIALWKLGFFKRSRPDPTLSGNLEKNNHESSPFIGRDKSIR